MLVSIGAIALNVGLNLYLIFYAGIGHRGLALSTALSATANFVTLFILMRVFAGGLDTLRFLSAVVRCVLAAAALGAVCVFGEHFLSGWLGGTAFLPKAVALGGLIACAGGAYLVACFLLRVEEMRDAFALIKRKLGRRG
jgi:putative peptidoglycan lipid II flippase